MALRPASLLRNSISRSLIAACLSAAHPGASLAQDGAVELVTRQVLQENRGDSSFYHQSKDWFVKCDYQVKSDNRRCQLTTLMVSPEIGQGLAVTLSILTGGRDTPPVAIVRTPLNLILSSGVVMKVDQRPVGTLTYRSCNERGCVVPFSLKGSVHDSLVKGTKVEFDLQDLSENTQTATFSLLGIAKAFTLAKKYN